MTDQLIEAAPMSTKVVNLPSQATIIMQQMQYNPCSTKYRESVASGCLQYIIAQQQPPHLSN